MSAIPESGTPLAKMSSNAQRRNPGSPARVGRFGVPGAGVHRPAGRARAKCGPGRGKSRLSGPEGRETGTSVLHRCHLREHLLVAGAGFEPATFGL